MLLWREQLSFGWILWLGSVRAGVDRVRSDLAGRDGARREALEAVLALPIPRWRVFAVKMLDVRRAGGAELSRCSDDDGRRVLLIRLGARACIWRRRCRGGDSCPLEVRAFAACWLLIVAHTWISVRYPGFAVPAGIGFAAMLLGFMAVNAVRTSGGGIPGRCRSTCGRKDCTRRAIRWRRHCSEQSRVWCSRRRWRRGIWGVGWKMSELRRGARAERQAHDAWLASDAGGGLGRRTTAAALSRRLRGDAAAAPRSLKNTSRTPRS